VDNFTHIVIEIKKIPATPTQEGVSNTKNEEQNKTFHNATEPTNNQSQKEKETKQLKTTTAEVTIKDNTETI